MKRITLFLALVSVSFACMAQSWNWINPTTGMQQINDISFVSSEERVAMGDYGTILHYQNGEWMVVESPVTTALNAVEFVSPNLAWAVGNDGVILRYDGNNWIQTSSPTAGTLNDLCCVDENHCWAVAASSLNTMAQAGNP